ncbi:MAG TPA: glycosyl hydrolase family 8 [Candidatus Binatia bacterium]|jgi:endo-1,4-beta-D-glucanase Y|nr:glycosyl hydrolase family 8 [Candidatus Binatia bacterium]
MRDALALALLLLSGVAHAAVNHPFGSHPTTYTAGAIRPSHVGQPALDQAVRDFYDQWKAVYLRQTCGAGRYVVVSKTQPGNLTVSEAHGYGMIVAALMAGHDPDAQRIFDGMYAYFREHPTLTHYHLMAFYQKTSCADAEGTDSASDGDLDIAFALLLADRQWGSCGAVDYLAAAQAVLADLVDGDLDASGRYVLLGDWAEPSEVAFYDSTRSSDFIVDHFRSFAAITGDATWTAVRDRTYQIVAALQATHSPSTGLLPDFVVDPLGTPDPAPSGFLEGPTDGAYSFNACRDPWRLATDWLVSGDARAKTAVDPINAWIRATTGNDPSAIGSGYALNGTPLPDTDEPHLAFVAPFAVGAMVNATNQAWLNALWDQVVGTPIGASDYYGNTLKLLSMLVLSNNWWAPENVAGGCVPDGTPLCTAGGTLAETQLRLQKLGGTAGDESLKLSGTVFFAQGIPVPGPLSVGARVVIEDLGAGGATVFDVTVPSLAAGTCSTRDGWKVTPKMALYRNKSGAADPPACTAGSAQGLVKLKLAPQGTHDVAVQVITKRSTLGTVAGPLRTTVVLGDTPAAGAAGQCGVSAPLVCAGSVTLRCEEAGS